MSAPEITVGATESPAPQRSGRGMAGITLVGVGLIAAFGYATWEGSQLPHEAGIFLEVFGIAGLVISAVYVAGRWSERKRAARAGEPAEESAAPEDAISDIAYDLDGVDPRTALRAFAGFYGGIALCCVAVWLFSFHVAVPTYVAIALRRQANVRRRVLPVVWLAFFLVIVLLFDYMIRITWHISVLEDLVGIRFGRTLGNIVRLVF